MESIFSLLSIFINYTKNIQLFGMPLYVWLFIIPFLILITTMIIKRAS